MNSKEKCLRWIFCIFYIHLGVNRNPTRRRIYKKVKTIQTPYFAKDSTLDMSRQSMVDIEINA